MTRLTAKYVRTLVAEMIADGRLPADPIAYVAGDIGHGTRFVFHDSYVALGPREAVAHLESLSESK